jgi:hypothetical protein
MQASKSMAGGASGVGGQDEEYEYDEEEEGGL